MQKSIYRDDFGTHWMVCDARAGEKKMQQSIYTDDFGTRWMTWAALAHGACGGGGPAAEANIRTLLKSTCGEHELPHCSIPAAQIDTASGRMAFGKNLSDMAFVETSEGFGTRIYVNTGWKPDDDMIAVGEECLFDDMQELADFLQNNGVLDSEMLQKTMEAWRKAFIADNREEILQAASQGLRERLEGSVGKEFVETVHYAMELEDMGTFEFDGYYVSDEDVKKLAGSIETILNGCAAPKM